MRKGNFQKIIALLWITASGCTWGNQKPPVVKAEPPEKLENPLAIQFLWSRQMEGAISDISLSGKLDMVVTTQPDVGIEKSAKTYLFSRLNSFGQLQWQQPLQSPVRDLDVSEDGLLTVLSNYEHQLIGMDPLGKVLWSIEGLCKPKVIQSLKQFLCYHDDDSEADVGFDVINWEGKKIASYPIHEDILAFKVSDSKKNAAIGLAKGKIALFRSGQIKPLWQRSVEGEVIDIAVSSETNPKVAVLFQDNTRTQKMAVYSFKGDLLARSAPSFHSIQIEFSPQGQAVFTYGNTSQGQNIGFYPAPIYEEQWKRGGSLSAVYSSSIKVTSDLVILGFEDSSVGKPKIHLLFFNHQGGLRADLPVISEEAAHLYTYRLSKNSDFLAVATDDGLIHSYRLTP